MGETRGQGPSINFWFFTIKQVNITGHKGYKKETTKLNNIF